jgi:hypothetical protein
MIAWGDGQVSPGTIGTSGSNFKVSGTHIYQHAGSFPVLVTIADAGGASTQTQPIIATVNGLNTQGANLTYTAGVSTNATVATFSDTDNDHTLSDYTVIVNWGDGQVTNNPTVVYTTAFQVQASHTYAQQGYYTITTSITDNVTGDSQTATVLSNANVTHGTLSGSSSLPSSSHSLAFAGQVASFSDSDLDSNSADFQAQIRWGMAA